MTAHPPPASKKFYLFGYPIAHSKAPALHNAWFGAWSSCSSGSSTSSVHGASCTDDDASSTVNGIQSAPTSNTYSLYSTSKIIDSMLELLASKECGGAAITMPLKFAILPFLDEVSPESAATGACNTVVKVPLGVREGADGRKGWKLVGTNTDILGVRNALLHALSSQLSSPSSSSPCSLPPAPRISGSALLIGGGATTRSAAYALTLLGLSPLYIINRDKAEVEAVVESMPGVQFIHLATVDDVQRYLGGRGKEIVMGVGAIRESSSSPFSVPTNAEEREAAIPPQTPAECAVYEVAGAVFALPYHSESASATIPCENGMRSQTRIYLEMAYIPLRTPLLQLAESHGWSVVDGVKATTQQGLAQQRMWFTGSASVEVGCDAGVLPGLGDVYPVLPSNQTEVKEVEVKRKELEVDRAEGMEAAQVPRR